MRLFDWLKPKSKSQALRTKTTSRPIAFESLEDRCVLSGGLETDLVAQYLQKLTAEDGTADDGFGADIAIDGDFAVVGSLADDLESTIVADENNVIPQNRVGIGHLTNVSGWIVNFASSGESFL